jgi:DNA helicase II / ATP-dependent DNA helicase PcrA
LTVLIPGQLFQTSPYEFNNKPVSDYLNLLNEPQRLAVQCTEGPVMIIAGAGSGKTRVLTYRIAFMLEKGIDPFNVLALTFTNKAAKEMKNRIAGVVGTEANNLWMGTFHSVFAKILRFEGHRLGYPNNFTIYDTDDSLGLLRDIIKEQGLDDKIYKPNLVFNRISAAKNNLCGPKEYLENPEVQNDDRMSGKPKLGQLFELYSKRCFKSGAMDFDDLLYKTYILFKNFPDVLEKYRGKFRYIMVDEFQDTNFAQYTVIRMLADAHRNICVVGDDAQSIYAFRGADIQNILSFGKDYPQLQVFKLEQNYRSTQMIVQAANNVILNNRQQLRKEVWTENPPGDKIRVMRALSDNEEGIMVANAIFQDKMNQQLRNKDFAILYRTNAQSRAMEEALRKLNIPYRIYGDLLAYFRLAINTNDEEALKRIINYPARGIGKTSLDRLIVQAAANETSIWAVVEDPDRFKLDVGTATRNHIADFSALIKSFSVIIQEKNAYEAASHIATASGLLKDLFADKTPEGVSRYENIQELLNGIKEFTEKAEPLLTITEDGVIEGSEQTRTLDLFMQDVALLTNADEEDDKENDDKVSLMTIHSAKGLEFKEVFVVGLEENLFPSQLSLNSRADLEEERRLFYVAITRAESKLTLSYASTRYKWGNLTSSEPSRFLSEIGEQFLDIQSPRENKEEAWSNSWAGNFQYRSPSARTSGNSQKPRTVVASSGKLTTDADFVPDDTSGLQTGMEVEHQRFGKGKVLQIEGDQDNRKATIFFQAPHGQKQLLLKFAKLKIKH